MLSMHELMDLRMQQQLAHEIYRQQVMQRIPDPFAAMLPLPMPHPQMIMPPRPTLPGSVDAKLENNDLWQQFHQIGTEMIITKSGRRMFPSMRVSLSGLDDESNYCVLLEMVPIGDCRYKFSGSQWVPAGGAEPQSPQRMYLHPDSPATGTHWQSQALLFNKVKLTNNTLDNNGHIVLASMHKYQPRLHIIKTSDLSQLPWAPQQAYIFPETEFVAVTAYQNDRITKLKIDNNPFAKGFRETGQSRCKRKLNTSDQDSSDLARASASSTSSGSINICSDDDRSSVSSFGSPQTKRVRTYEDDHSSSGSLSPHFGESLYATTPLPAPHSFAYQPYHAENAAAYFGLSAAMPTHLLHMPHALQLPQVEDLRSLPQPAPLSTTVAAPIAPAMPESPPAAAPTAKPAKRNNFSISAILAF